jgi:patatin-like phospholipase/acyl hydrolase
MERNTFNILSIDGGGIRGVFPAKFLASLEHRLAELGNGGNKIHQHFDLICGTSTGGIIAIALALGIPADKILELYMNHAADIFGKRRPWYKSFTHSKYSNASLTSILKDTFKDGSTGNDLRLNDCKTNICIPIYDLFEGKPSVLKNKYHSSFTRDYHIPAYQAALATAAAPTYFDPFSGSYNKIQTESPEDFSNKVDGGVFANNPALVGIIEAQKSFGKNLNEIKVLSIGTGTKKYTDAKERSKWGKLYWVNKMRIFDLFLQGQSQHTSNLISLLQNGVAKSESKNGGNFAYQRIDIEFDSNFSVELDENNKLTLKRLAEKAATQFQNYGSSVIETYCSGGRGNIRV